jgi:hypothetical protein
MKLRPARPAPSSWGGSECVRWDDALLGVRNFPDSSILLDLLMVLFWFISNITTSGFKRGFCAGPIRQFRIFTDSWIFLDLLMAIV